MPSEFIDFPKQNLCEISNMIIKIHTNMFKQHNKNVSFQTKIQYRQPKHQGDYCIIHLQDLSYIKKQSNINKVSDRQIIQKMLHNQKQQSNSSFQVYCFKDSSSEKRQISRYNNFFGAFFDAYNTHKNIELVPDDIWIMITLYLSKYIEKHAQKLRSQFVKHDGKKQLTVIEYASTVKQSLEKQKQWDYFFKQIIVQIQKNTVGDIVNQLKCDFSTTTQVHQLISTSVIMGALKQYFNYCRYMTFCGINDIYFKGSLGDWHKLQKKLNELHKYDVDGDLIKYIEALNNILDNFIMTYQGQVDVNWWNQMMVPHYPGSGADKIDGWILHFFGIYKKIDFEQIPQTLIEVPIKLINELNNTQKNLKMLTDWGSYSQTFKDTYKPNIAVGIIENLQKQKL